MTDWREAVDFWIDSLADELRSIRRHLHSHPEPSREEYQTTRFLASRLEAEGVPHELIPSRRGILAGALESGGPPLAAFRADVDALRIADAKDVPYRSRQDGVMHACGHDAHATMALGAALALWRCREVLPSPSGVASPLPAGGGSRRGGLRDGRRRRDGWRRGRVGPARRSGAADRTGRLSRRADHRVLPRSPSHDPGRGRPRGAAAPDARSDSSRPRSSSRPSTSSCRGRSTSRDPTVVTFGSIQGGTSGNIIPDHVALRGTIRTFSRARPAARRRAHPADRRGDRERHRDDFRGEPVQRHRRRRQRPRGHCEPASAPRGRSSARRTLRRSPCRAWGARISRDT